MLSAQITDDQIAGLALKLSDAYIASLEAAKAHRASMGGDLVACGKLYRISGWRDVLLTNAADAYRDAVHTTTRRAAPQEGGRR